MRLRRGRLRGPPVRAGRASARPVPPPPGQVTRGPSARRRCFPRTPFRKPRRRERRRQPFAAGPQDGPQSLGLCGAAARRRQPELPQRPVLRGRLALQPRAAGDAGARYTLAPLPPPGLLLARPPGPRYPEPAPPLPPWDFHSPRPTAPQPPARSPRGRPARNFLGPSFRLGGEKKSRGFITGSFPLDDRSETYFHSNRFFYHFLVMVKTLS